MKKIKVITAAIATASILAGCTGTSSTKIPKGYEGKCGECREEVESDYKYCMYCGTKVGEGSFKPYENRNECVYGAPQDYTLECDDCDFELSDNTMGSVPDYCPYCGKEADVEIERDK